MANPARHDGTVLVTGGAGYIGSHVVLALQEAGIACVVLDNLSTGFRDAVPAGVPFVEADISDGPRVGETIRRHGCCSIIHFAASIVVPESVADPIKYYRNNLCASTALIGTALETGISRMVFSSTAAVYGEPETIPVPESAPVQPLNPYGASKAMVEQVLRDASRAHGLEVAILRYFNVAGADPQGRAGQRTKGATHLIKVACEVATGQRQALEIFGTDYATPDGTCVRDYIHVSDLADAHLLALQHLAAGHGSLLLNCGYGRGYSVHDVVASIERVTGRPLPVRLAPRRPGDSSMIVATGQAVRDTLGWRPRHDDLEAIVRSAYEWELRARAPA